MKVIRIKTLADLNLSSLHDAPTGRVVADTEGKPDDPGDYVVLNAIDHDGCVYLAVRGPSGQIDVATQEGTLYRDALQDAEDLLGWLPK